jgi:hypothetical protein
MLAESLQQGENHRLFSKSQKKRLSVGWRLILEQQKKYDAVTKKEAS